MLNKCLLDTWKGDGSVGEWVDGWMGGSGWMDGWMDGQMGGWVGVGRWEDG